ncbi:MAG: hypothetical protein ACFE85_05625 [Candidatus Hodarchaeota archaeon]
MNGSIYKVIFKGDQAEEVEFLSLTFKNVITEKPIHIPTQFFSNLKILSETNQSVINFQNIEEVLSFGETSADYKFNYYIIVLFTNKKDNKKEGFLIGNVKKLGDILIGIWPFNDERHSISPEIILGKFNELVNQPNNFENICLIYS